MREVSIHEVKPYWRNPRNNRKALDPVRDSIAAYGYNQLIVVDSQLVIIAGHTRYAALVELGYERIKVMVADLDQQLAKQYRIVDNKTSEYAEWDAEALESEMREIVDLQGLQRWFDEDIGALLADQAWTRPTPEAIEQKKKELEAGRKPVESVEVMCPHCGGTFAVRP